jgi:hypothetical protein
MRIAIWAMGSGVALDGIGLDILKLVLDKFLGWQVSVSIR